jgi:hypothetical protein
VVEQVLQDQVVKAAVEMKALQEILTQAEEVEVLIVIQVEQVLLDL